MVNLFSLEDTTQESYDFSRGRFKKKIIMIIINSNKKVNEDIKYCNDRYKEELKKLNDDNYEKKTDLKNNLNNQDKDNNNVEAKEYDTFEDFATDMLNNIFNKYR